MAVVESPHCWYEADRLLLTTCFLSPFPKGDDGVEERDARS
jgi:hypothetical protein